MVLQYFRLFLRSLFAARHNKQAADFSALQQMYKFLVSFPCKGSMQEMEKSGFVHITQTKREQLCYNAQCKDERTELDTQPGALTAAP